MYRFCLPLLLLITVHTSAQSVASGNADSAADVLDQIRAVIADARCDHAEQCRTVALGAKACGGPEFYLAWSTIHTSPKHVHELAARHASLRKAQIAASGELSDCRLIADPGAFCQSGQSGQPGHCVLRSTSGRGTAVSAD